ncbi:CDP-alcohol phosphatidyltransferase family protein [Pengzhenrongella sicca]|uniref:CDP-alcohol phosphatidyltransferase family protein n=1 Tax=Pengzhenrongella sicca TaxID=2819238 RepID=A0A8A4ZDF1_9MICO|nr:CDP-alcohol phosphatidyltransferase family protein [Pengzhenrongella sicca]QTE28507.1 CDP-alcohol phosphatidyltransferase family protein [Pengzhenrongella sicca]
MILGSWHRSVVLTYVGAATSALGMSLAISGHLRGAVAALVVAGLADLFDGPLARATTRTDAQRAFGVQVDSLTDVVSFVAFPVVLVSALVGEPWVVPVLALYTVAGLARLTHFTVAAGADDTPRQFFHGLPVTYAALVLPLTALLRPHLGAAFGPLLAAVTAALAVLFVLDVPVPKPAGAAYAGLGLLAVATLVALAVVGI